MLNRQANSHSRQVERVTPNSLLPVVKGWIHYVLDTSLVNGVVCFVETDVLDSDLSSG